MTTTDSTANATGASADAGGWAARPRWLRSLVEVGLPAGVVLAIAIVVLSSGGASRPIPNQLNYDKRAMPLAISMRAARTHQLKPGETIDAGGGCTGTGSSWTCDLQVRQRNGGVLRETYDARWNPNGCWSAFEDCVSPLYSAQRRCPPTAVILLQGCITPAQAAASG